MEKCLILIDLQKGFITKETIDLVEKIPVLLEAFWGGMIIATKYINTPDSPYRMILNWDKLAEAPETDVIECVVKSADYICEKNIYSGYTPELREILREKGLEEVYIAGIDTDGCVLKTALDLFEDGIRPIVLAQYCASTGGIQSHEAGLKVLERTIGRKQLLDDIEFINASEKYFLNMIGYDTWKKRYSVDRCFGYFHEYAEVLEIVLNNYTDIAENGFYEYCCIEKIPEGLYKQHSKRQFFRYNEEKNKYEECDALKDFEKYTRITF